MKAFVITGTSSGLGRALFDVLAAQAGKVVAISRRFSPEQEPEAARAGGRIRLVKLDLGEVEQLPGSQELREWLGGDIDEVVFINNAFSDQPMGPVGGLRPQDVAYATRVNIIAPMILMNALLGAIDQGVPVRVLDITAGAAKRAVAGWTMYCAAKAGLEMFFDVVALESPGHVTVHHINPGLMDTPMQERIRGSDFPDRERFVAMKERGELARPEDVAKRIAEEYLRDA